jgi:hypothetical protein
LGSQVCGSERPFQRDQDIGGFGICRIIFIVQLKVLSLHAMGVSFPEVAAQTRHVEFTTGARNAVFIDGSGAGKTHLATVIGVEAIQKYTKRVRFFSTVELVNALELEKTHRYRDRHKSMVLASNT